MRDSLNVVWSSYERVADRTASTGSRVRGPMADCGACGARPLLAHHVPARAASNRNKPQDHDGAGSTHAYRLLGIFRDRAALIRPDLRPFWSTSDVALRARDLRRRSARVRARKFSGDPHRGARSPRVWSVRWSGVGRAMVRDLYGAKGSAKAMAFVASALSIAPAIAPVFGGISPEQPGGRGSSLRSRSLAWRCSSSCSFEYLKRTRMSRVALFASYRCWGATSSLFRAVDISATCPSPQ